MTCGRFPRFFSTMRNSFKGTAGLGEIRIRLGSFFDCAGFAAIWAQRDTVLVQYDQQSFAQSATLAVTARDMRDMGTFLVTV